MSLYSARLLFEIDIEQATNKHYSEELYLVKASNEFEAFHKSQTKGQQQNESFVNKLGHTVQWHFLGVIDLVPLHSSQSIIAIDSKTIEPDNPGRYVKGLRDKFDKLLQSYLYPVPN